MGNPKKKGGRTTDKKVTDFCQKRSNHAMKAMNHLLNLVVVKKPDGTIVDQYKQCSWCGVRRP